MMVRRKCLRFYMKYMFLMEFYFIFIAVLKVNIFCQFIMF